MVSNLDIWRAANLLIREYGADADLEASRLQDQMFDRGDDRSDAGTGAPRVALSGPKRSLVRRGPETRSAPEPSLGDRPFRRTSVGHPLGKGMGDLPASLPRPIAVTGRRLPLTLRLLRIVR
jgi:hypothetical protein